MLNSLVIVLIALFFSAFFSGMEIAFVASNKLKFEIDKKQNRIFNYIIDIFNRHPGQYITTILVGNNISLVVYSLNMTELIQGVGSYYGWQGLESSIVGDTLIATIIIIFTAEFLPKAIVRINPNMYMRAFIVPVFFFYVLLYPIARLSTIISVIVLRVFGFKIRGGGGIRNFDRVDLTNLVEEAVDNEYETSNEKEIKLFQNAMDFSDRRVRDCMVPRVDIEMVDADTTMDELSERFISSKYSRIFIYQGSTDNIIGYVNIKSLFNLPRSISEIMMRLDFVPESMPAQQLMNNLAKSKQSVAIVVDEFGGTAGMVSMEDVLEEIFGEIEDEHDSQDMVEKRLKEGDYIFSCRLEVEYLNEKYKLDIPESEEYETLAGYIIFVNNGLPEKGETLIVENKHITIVKMGGSKVELARVRIVS